MFSGQLRFTLDKLYPSGETLTVPETPFIKMDEALKRSLSLLRPLPRETASSTMRHINCIGAVCRVYPEFSRLFLEGGVLAQSVKAIGARAFAPGNLAPQSPREYPNSNDWDEEILDDGSSIIQFWIALLRSGNVKGNQKDEKAISAVSKALDAEFIDRIAYIAIRVTDEEGTGAHYTFGSLY